jgi:carboxyl-terminal processing protease
VRPAQARLGPLALAALALLLGAACGGRLPPSSTTAPRSASKAARKQERLAKEAAERALQLAAFDQAWQRIDETYPYADFRGLDWAAVKAELRPQAALCRTPACVRPVLQQMLARLGESHFQVLPGDGLPVPAPAAPGAAQVTPGSAPPQPASLRGDVGLQMRQVGGEFVVTRVDEEGPAHAAGLRTGWTVLSVAGHQAADVLRRAAGSATPSLAHYLAWAILDGSLRGEPGSKVALHVAPPGGTPRVVELVRREPVGESTQLGNMPDLVADFESRTLEGGVGYIRFGIFLAPVAEPFSQAVRGFVKEGAPGVVIDLRGNPGGVGGMVMGLAGHFVKEKGRSLGAMKTREATLDFVANPRSGASRFDGPVAILVDGLSLSTSELFAAGMQQLGRARLFGERTGGMALPSIIETLPNGDRLQFAVADLTAPGGRRLEGVGVAPDEPAPLRKEDLVAGRDAALDAAVRWIMSQTPPAAPGS